VLGRPRNVIDAERVKQLREQGRSWSQISRELRQGVGTCRRAYVRYVRSQ
jgi:hypothetical protein